MATITVHDCGTTLVEPVLGAARYPDGSTIVVTERHSPHMPALLPQRWAYRTAPHLPSGEWATVWRTPEAWLDFITRQPVGTLGKVSNRRIEVIDLATAAPSGSIHIARTTDKMTW